MRIEQVFRDDINRKINGVVQVAQDEDNILVQEIEEYVITKELKKRFMDFFSNYSESFDEPTSDIGVWISGFYGSGKSHFLKMLSYLLENKKIQGITTVERFRKKFEDDPGTFMLIDKATKAETDTVLFNIDTVGSMYKDKTAVLKVFAKMFYNYLGFYGEDLKVAKLEQHIDRQGKTDEFRRVFEQKNGQSWLEARNAYAFYGDNVVETLQEVLGMSETSARNWFDGTEEVDMSINQLVSEMKNYVSAKSKNFRLLFMIDEVGQYVGGDTSLLLNLQSIIEEIGGKCGGHVWVICTGQEAIDEIVIKVRENEFSRIQARFGTRLSLSSSSVDEVIQKRILSKTPEAAARLKEVFDKSESVLRNLFSFSDSVKDIKGYRSTEDFVKNFPFVPYQFIIMQKVFTEIRKHGNLGMHFSDGERSMLSGFQETAQKIKDKNEYSLAPFYLFYDTVHTSLNGAIRRVIERCQRAADNKDGIEPEDVDILKLLYLIRYIEDIPATVDNIIILMADNINMDKIDMRSRVQESLDRLFSENYIGRSGNRYNFLTDEEQDVQKDIKNTNVDPSVVVNRIKEIIFGEIYTKKKFRYDKYDFPFDQMVDNVSNGATTGGMCLRFYTVVEEKGELELKAQSLGNEAIVVLSDEKYYETLENAEKIRKYSKQKVMSQLSGSVQDIIKSQIENANNYEAEAKESIIKAIENGKFYVAGEIIDINSGTAESKIEKALGYLVDNVYSKLDMIDTNADSDADIREILDGSHNRTLDGFEPNKEAVAKVMEYLEMQSRHNISTSMAMIQSRYSGIPYGWREIDIASVVASLIYDQKVTVKYKGTTIQPSDKRLVDMLRKKSETGNTIISKRVIVSSSKIKNVRDFLREYFNIMDIPDDEDGLVNFIVEKFEAQKDHYENLKAKYNGKKYPDKKLVDISLDKVGDVLRQKKDNIALIDYIIAKIDELLDNKEDMERVEEFFKSQISLFDEAVNCLAEHKNDRTYIEADDEAKKALDNIRYITMVENKPKYDYKRIPELNALISKVNTVHSQMLDNKRAEMKEIMFQCMPEIHRAANEDPKANDIVREADKHYADWRQKIDAENSIAVLESFRTSLWDYMDSAKNRIEIAIKPVTVVPPDTPPKKEKIKLVARQIVFPSKELRTEEEIDKYLSRVRDSLINQLKGNDGIKIN